MADNDNNPEVSLCDLMLRLKLENPNFGRRELHSAVIAEGPEWEKITFADVDKKWKKMKKKSTKSNIGNALHSDKTADQEKKSHSTLRHEHGADACDDKDKFNKVDSIKNKCTKHTSKPSSEQREVTVNEVHKAIDRDQVLNTGNKSQALEKQLKMLHENPNVNYIVFTPPSDSSDCAVQLSNPMGELFYNIMWNRVVEAPFGSKGISRELWMIYQQLEYNLMPRYKKILRKQLEEEFGVDPFDGKADK